MLPPHELKNKNFSHSIRGYSVAEVDDYIEFLLDRYADVYRRNDQLEKELRMVLVRLEELTEKEDAINRALVNAQRIEEKLINEANEKAELITRAAKTNADKILNDFHKKITKERAVLHELRTNVEEFKKYVLSEYEEHIAAINQLSPPLLDEPEWETDPEEYTEKVIAGIREAANQAAEMSEQKHRREEILASHTEKSEPEAAHQTENNEEIQQELALRSIEEKNDCDTVVESLKEEQPASAPVENKRNPALRNKRPRPRRTIESSAPQKAKPVPPTAEESDTEEALDLLFNDKQ